MASGSKYYFTGEPCSRGHIANWFTSGATCVECDRMRKQDPEGFRNTRLRCLRGTRAAAIANGDETYQGKPCKHCGGTTRTAKTAQCVSPKCWTATCKEYEDRRSDETKRAHLDRVKAWRKERAAAGFTRTEEHRANYIKNKDKRKVYSAQWRKDNAAKIRSSSYRRIAMKKQAVPPWETPEMRECIDDMYRLADIMSRKVPHEVDHIVPLKGKTVCGLHVPWNLWVITALENRSRPRNWQPCNLNNLEVLAKNGLNDLPKILAYTG